jgi:Flp pilus assembly protein TadG
MNMPTQAQFAAAGRHALTFSMGATAAVAALHVISGDQASTITTSVTQIGNGVAQIATGLAPLIALATGAYAAWTASRKSQIAAVNDDKTNGVKVVSETSPSPQINAPIIPPAAK